MWAIALVFFLAALYQAGKAEYWKRQAENPWDAAWRSFEKRQLRDPRHPASPRVLP